MGHSVQSQAGVSIADVYDVKGSQQPIERVTTADVAAVHEMGATIQSERFSTTIRRRSTGDLAQNAVFDELITDLPAGVTRILGVSVIALTAARTAAAAVMVRDPVSGREFPIFIWDTDVDTVKDIRIVDNGAAVGFETALIPDETTPPSLSMLTGPDQPASVPDIAFRGSTTGFGAGTVEIVLLIHLAFASIGGISSRGLTIPSW